MNVKFLKLFLTGIVMCTLAGTGLYAPKASAALVTTDRIAVDAGNSIRSVDVARQEIRARLTGLGVDPVEAEARVAALSDSEAVNVHDQLEELPAGGVLGLIALILVIFIITDAAGATDVFPGV